MFAGGLGVVLDGYFGDSARTYAVGDVDDETTRLLRVTDEALKLGLAQAKAGNRVSDIGHAVQTHVEKHGFSVVREFVGHGIGSHLHEEPQVATFRRGVAARALKHLDHAFDLLLGT